MENIAPIINLPSSDHEGLKKIESLSQADWALEIISASEARKAENKRIAEARHRRTDAHLEAENAREDRETAWVRALLEEFVATERALVLGGKTRRKSRDLEHGTLGYRAQPRHLLIEKQDEAVRYARSQPIELRLYRTTYAVNHAEFQAHAESEGVTPPGCRWQGGGPDEPFIKPKLPKGDEP